MIASTASIGSSPWSNGMLLVTNSGDQFDIIVVRHYLARLPEAQRHHRMGYRVLPSPLRE
jgi:hypothetical protein